MWDDSERWMERGGAPPVETWCLFGTGEPEAGGQAVAACITSPLEVWCLFGSVRQAAAAAQGMRSF